MYNLSSLVKVLNKIPAVSGNYKVLHFDEYPILFMGTNVLGNHLVGSFVEEREDNTLLYFHSIVSSRVLNKFIKRKISYLSVLESAIAIFMVNKDINDKVVAFYEISYEQIEVDYLPLDSSFCPQYHIDNALDFSVSLKGLIADKHEALVDSVSKISSSFYGLVEDAFKSVHETKVGRQITLQPMLAGSFMLNFKVSIFESGGMFFDQQSFNNYISHYIEYCIDDLHEEVKTSSPNNDSKGVKKITKLVTRKKELLTKLGYKSDTNVITKELITSVNKSLKSVDGISEEVGNGFNQLEVFSKPVGTEADVPIAFIDELKSNKISKAYDYLRGLGKNEGEVKIPRQDMRIKIYHLNTDTRVGNAYIKNLDDDSKNDKPKIEILGDVDLSGSKYTESLHMDTWITVNASGLLRDGKFRRLSIYGDFSKDS